MTDNFNFQEDILETFLTDTSGAEDMCLTRDLIRVGHADKRNDSALRVSDERPTRKHVIRKQELKEALVRSDSDVDVDVRSIAESVRRFACAGDESCSASQVLGPASRMPVWDADDDDASSTSTVVSTSLAHLANRLSCRAAPARPPDSDSGSSLDSSEAAPSSRVLLRKLQLKNELNVIENDPECVLNDDGESSLCASSKTNGNNGSGSNDSGSTICASSISSRVLLRKLELNRKQKLNGKYHEPGAKDDGERSSCVSSKTDGNNGSGSNGLGSMSASSVSSHFLRRKLEIYDQRIRHQ